MTKIDEFGSEVIVRGGVGNQFQCRISASVIDPFNPITGSDFFHKYIQYEGGEIEMSLKPYLDIKFLRAMGFIYHNFVY